MKKLVILAAAVMGAVALNAATVTWSATGAAYNGTAVSGRAYIYFATAADTSWVAALDKADAAAVSSAVSSHGYALDYTPSAAGDYAYTAAKGFTPKTNEELGLAGSTAYQAYLVIFDTTEIAAGSHFMASAVKNVTTLDNTSASNKNILFGNQSSATWYEVAPEPTSGLMMLLGMGVLALRRKRA